MGEYCDGMIFNIKKLNINVYVIVRKLIVVLRMEHAFKSMLLMLKYTYPCCAFSFFWID